MNKINVEKILLKHCGNWSSIDREEAREAIKEIVKAVVDKCADEAKIEYRYWNVKEAGEAPFIDKQSILAVKEEVDYGI